MHRLVSIIGAPSSIGIRPYDTSGEARQLDRTPSVLRELGLVARLGASDLGDVVPPPYRDFMRRPGQARNEHEVRQYSYALADRVAAGSADGRFVLVLGGDCSIILGSLLGASRQFGRIGLAYIDAHADFATPAESLTGSVAGMCLALAVGRGDSDLARLTPATALVQAADVALIGRRDELDGGDDLRALGHAGMLDLPYAVVAQRESSAIASAILARVGRAELDGFWIHVDADVLNPLVMPAVDSPEPGGPDIAELATLLAPLVAHPRARGMQLTIYDPALDLDRSCALGLVTLLELLLGGRAAGNEPSPQVQH